MAIINTAGLARTFATKHGPVEAVRGIDLTVREGEILGFLGPNGAGKTTTSGCSRRCSPPPAARPPSPATTWRPTLAECARRAGTWRSRAAWTRRSPCGRNWSPRAACTACPGRGPSSAPELARDLGLTELLDRRCGALSGGQRRRLDIAMALTHRPKVLFLDGPTTGLDPGSRADLWDLVRRLRDEHGTTVFLTTHYLDRGRRPLRPPGGRGPGCGGRRGHADRPEAGVRRLARRLLQDTFLAVTGRSAAPADAAPVAV